MSRTTITIEFDRLYHAFCNGSWEQRYYLDCQSGDVEWVTEKMRRKLQDVYDAVGEDSAEKHFKGSDGEIYELEKAHKIEMDDERFLKIPERKIPIDVYDDFANSCEPAIKKLLWRALDSQGLAHFERILMMDERSGLYAGWHEHLKKHAESELKKWLKRENLHVRWR